MRGFWRPLSQPAAQGAFPSPPTPPPPPPARGVPEAPGWSSALCPATPTNLRRGAGRGVRGLRAPPRLPPPPPDLGLRQRRWRPRRSLGAGRGRGRDCGDLGEGNGKRTPAAGGGLPHGALHCPGLGREPGRGGRSRYLHTVSSGTWGGEGSESGRVGVWGVPGLGCREKPRWVSAGLGGPRSGDSPSSERCPQGCGQERYPRETPPWSPRTGAVHIPIALSFTPGTPVGICLDGGVMGSGVSPPGAVTKDPGMGPS